MEDRQELSPGHYEGGVGRGVGERRTVRGRGTRIREWSGDRVDVLWKINKSYPLVTTKVGRGVGERRTVRGSGD